MKIFRYSNFPTKNSPGSGLAAYNLSKDSNLTSCILCKEISAECREVLEESNISINSLSSNPFIYKIVKKNIFLRSLLVMFHGFVFLRKSNLIHIHNIDGIFLLLAALVLQKKVMYTFHGTDFVRVSKSKILRHLFSKTDALLFVSQNQLVLAESLFETKCVYVGNGVLLPSIQTLADVPLTNQLVSIGGLRWQKNYQTLIKAYKKSTFFEKKIPLVIYGEGELRKDLENLIINLGLQELVNLNGIIPKDQLNEELATTKYYVQSSVSEALPKSLLEAMSYNCYSMTTKAGDCHKALGEFGVIADTSDISGIQNALNILIDFKPQFSKKDLHEYLQKNFSWTAYASTHQAIYNEIVA
jgi:glycosyltransferase involved in cell wall biosynthesis